MTGVVKNRLYFTWYPEVSNILRGFSVTEFHNDLNPLLHYPFILIIKRGTVGCWLDYNLRYIQWVTEAFKCSKLGELQLDPATQKAKLNYRVKNEKESVS